MLRRVMQDSLIQRVHCLSDWLSREGFDIQRPISWTYDSYKGWWVVRQELAAPIDGTDA